MLLPFLLFLLLFQLTSDCIPELTESLLLQDGNTLQLLESIRDFGRANPRKSPSMYWPNQKGQVLSKGNFGRQPKPSSRDVQSARYTIQQWRGSEAEIAVYRQSTSLSPQPSKPERPNRPRVGSPLVSCGRDHRDRYESATLATSSSLAGCNDGRSGAASFLPVKP